MFYAQSPYEYEWFTSFNTTQPRDHFPAWPHHNMTGRHWNKQTKAAHFKTGWHHWLQANWLTSLVTGKSITFVTSLLLSSWLVGTGTNKQRQHILKLADIIGYKQTGWLHWLQANWLTSLVTSKSITLVTSILLSSGQIHGSLCRLGINWRIFTFQSPVHSELSLTWKQNTDPDK